MSSSASTQNAVPIEMKDMTGFKFVILNILGHDYMHDFLLSSNRTKKGSVVDGNKKVSLLKKSSKILRGIAKYYNKVDSNFMKKLMKGGGMFDNPDEMTDVDVASISDSKSDRTSTSDISVTPTNDISTIDSDISTFDKELYTIDELIDILPNQYSVSSAEGEKSGNSDEDNDLTEDSELIANIHEYFQDLSGVRKNADGEIIEFNPTIIKILAESMVTGILSPVISKMLDIGKRNHLKNRNMTYELLDSQYNSLFGIDYGEDDEDDEINED